MTCAIWRQYTAVFCTFLMIATPITLPGCDIPGGSVDDAVGEVGGIMLSTSKSAPGEFFTISQPSIANGATVEVDFVMPDGFSMTSTIIAKQDGFIRLMAPPVVSQTGEIDAGVVMVSVRGISSKAQLEITDLPPVGALVPGAGIRALFASMVEDYQATLAELEVFEADFGESEDITAAVSDINEQIAILEDRMSQIDANGTLDLGESDAGPFVLSTADLAVADQLIVAVLIGALEEQQLEPLDLIGAKSAAPRQQTIEERQEASNQNVQQAIRNLKGTPALGINSGTVVLGVFSLGLMIASAVVVPAAVAPTAAFIGVFGVMLTVGDAFFSFTTAPILKASTEAFNNNNGPEFDASQQLLIEVTGPVLGDKAGEIGSAFPQTAGRAVTFIGVTQAIVKVNTAVVDVKCMQMQMEQPPKINQQLTDVGEFCEAVRPATGGADDDNDNSSSNLCNVLVCPRGVCDPLTGDCVGCVNDQECVDQGLRFFCDTDLGLCDECKSDQDCIDLGLGFVCDFVGNCNDCESDQDCLNLGLGPRCGTFFDCVECFFDDDCQEGQECDAFLGECISRRSDDDNTNNDNAFILEECEIPFLPTSAVCIDSFDLIDADDSRHWEFSDFSKTSSNCQTTCRYISSGQVMTIDIDHGRFDGINPFKVGGICGGVPDEEGPFRFSLNGLHSTEFHLSVSMNITIRGDADSVFNALSQIFNRFLATDLALPCEE